jgi:hypothetical protein
MAYWRHNFYEEQMSKVVSLIFHNVIKWTQKQALEYRIFRKNKNAFKIAQRRFLWRLKQVTLKGTERNEKIKNVCEVNKMTQDIKECQKWRNLVCRMPDCRLPKRVFICRSRGKRHLGNRWMRWSAQRVKARKVSKISKPCQEDEELIKVLVWHDSALLS